MWLLEKNVYERLLATILKPDAEKQKEYLAAKDDSGILQVVGNQANIPIEGILTRKPDWLIAWFYGSNTAYSEIQDAFLKAENNPAIETINFTINSPGGTVDGLFETLDMLAAAKKKTRAVVDGMAASAAYAIASQMDSIEASNRADDVGSIGVAASYRVSENIIDIASTQAPKKRPDVTTEEGKAIVREELDAIHELFVDAIANGRTQATGKQFTIKMINSDFGRGAMVLADEAVKRGMIDSVASSSPINMTASIDGGVKAEEKRMDLNTLKAQHPDLYAAVVQEGVTKERDRVTAHLTYGETCGAMNVATKAVKDGSEMTQTLSAEYMTAGRNKTDIENRDTEDVDASVVDSNDADVDVDLGDQVADAVEKKLGIGGTDK